MATLAAIILIAFASIQLPAASPKPQIIAQPTIQSTTEKAQKALKSVTDEFDEEAAKRVLNALYAEGVQSIKVELEGKSLFPDTANPTMDYLNQMVSLPTLQNETDLHRTLGKVYRVFVELTWYQAWQKGGGTAVIPVFPTTKDKIIKSCEDMIEILAKRRNAPDAEFEYRMAREAAKLLMPSEGTWEKFLVSTAAAISGAATLNFVEVWEGLKNIKEEFDEDGVQEWYIHTFLMRWILINACKPQDLKTGRIHTILKASIEKCMEEGREYAQGFLMALKDILENPCASPQLKEIAVVGDRDLPGLLSFFEKDDLSAIVAFCDRMGMDMFAQKFDRFRDARLMAHYLVKKILTDPKFNMHKEKCYAALEKRNSWLQHHHQERLQEEKLKVRATLDEIRTEVEALAATEKALLTDLIAKVSHPAGKYYITTPHCSLPEQRQIEKEILEINQKLRMVASQQVSAQQALAEKEHHLDHCEELAAAIEVMDVEEIQALQQILKELELE